jgi:glutathione S-transferase
MNVALIDLFYANEEWARLRRPGEVEFAQRRLSVLSESLGDKPYLDGEHFTPGDLMMTTVLRILKHTDIVTSHKRLAADVDRCTAHGLPSSERWMLRLAISERPYSRRSANRAGKGRRSIPLASNRKDSQWQRTRFASGTIRTLRLLPASTPRRFPTA